MGGISDDEIETAVTLATASLQREMTTLKEQLELFEMKHETIMAASEQFRSQSKSAKTKLEEERKRYDILASEKESLEMSIETKVAIALEDQKVKFEDTIAAELIEKRNLLAKENEDLVKKLRRSESQISMLEDEMKENLLEQSRKYEISEGKRRALEEKLRTDGVDLRNRLSYTEKQSKSFESSWKKAVAELEAKDEYFQEESAKRLEEAGRWEKRLQKLNAESKDLYEENQKKEIELIRAKKVHLTLLEKLQESDEAVKNHEAKIKSFTAEIAKLSKDLKFTSSELTQSKKDHALLFDKFENLSKLHKDTEFTLMSIRTEAERTAARNEELQNEIVDAKFEMETSQRKTRQTIEEKNEMTKAYTEALEQMSSKNSLLRYELVDIKLELEQSQNETDALRVETFEITNAHKNALDGLESEGKKLKLLQAEYSSLKKDFETITDQFNVSQMKVKTLQQRAEEEAATNAELKKELLYSELRVESSEKVENELSGKNTELLKMYEEIQKTMGSSEKKLLETMQQYQKSQDNVDKLNGSVHELEEKVKELMEQLESKVSKNSYLQKSLLDTKYSLEESQKKAKLLEAQMAERSTDNQHLGTLEVEKKKMIERAQTLERELQESTSLYNVASRQINDLRDQLSATEARSVQFSSMYESMKEENEALNRSLRTSQKLKSEFYSSNLELQEKNESFEQCGKDLHETQAKYSKLLQEYGAAKDNGTEKNARLQQEESKGETDKVEPDVMASAVEDDTTSQNKQESQKKSQGSSFSFFKWLDYALYKILRVVVDLIGFLANSLWQILSSTAFFARLAAPFKSIFAIASWGVNEFRVIHDALVSLFEFELTFVSSLVSSEKDRSAFDFLIRNSQMFVMFGEAIAILLCVDFIVSSFLNPIKTKKRRPRAKTIHVPKSANASLLRKANNM